MKGNFSITFKYNSEAMSASRKTNQLQYISSPNSCNLFSKNANQ